MSARPEPPGCDSLTHRLDCGGDTLPLRNLAGARGFALLCLEMLPIHAATCCKEGKPNSWQLSAFGSHLPILENTVLRRGGPTGSAHSRSRCAEAVNPPKNLLKYTQKTAPTLLCIPGYRSVLLAIFPARTCNAIQGSPDKWASPFCSGSSRRRKKSWVISGGHSSDLSKFTRLGHGLEHLPQSPPANRQTSTRYCSQLL